MGASWAAACEYRPAACVKWVLREVGVWRSVIVAAETDESQ
jgi:hypothetical protein